MSVRDISETLPDLLTRFERVLLEDRRYQSSNMSWTGVLAITENVVVERQQ